VQFEELVQLKKNIPFLADLSTQELQDLLQAARIRIYRQAQTLFREGDEADGMYILLAGQVKVEKRLEQGDSIVLSKLNPGDVFGEMALIEQKPRSASVRAVGQATVFFVDSLAFETMRRQFHPAAMKILRQLCLVLVQRVRRLDAILAEFFDNPEKSLEFMEQRYLKYVGHPATEAPSKE
jgi:CRP-like cAMP-binding protein